MLPQHPEQELFKHEKDSERQL